MLSLLAVAAIASRTGVELRMLSATVRRCERSGPITAVRMRRKCTRRTRDNLRTVRSESRPCESAITWLNNTGLE